MQTIIDRLEHELINARDAATMVNAGFGFSHEFVIACDADGKPHDGCKPVQKTEFIKDTVRLYMGSWVHGPIQRALADIERNTQLVADVEKIAALIGSHETRVILDRIDANNHANMQAATR